jgi:hypothetical protein
VVQLEVIKPIGYPDEFVGLVKMKYLKYYNFLKINIYEKKLN